MRLKMITMFFLFFLLKEKKKILSYRLWIFFSSYLTVSLWGLKKCIPSFLFRTISFAGGNKKTPYYILI